jgi:site-specific recombinase XerD
MQGKGPERWLALQENMGLTPNTLVAYRRALEEYATFCASRHLEVRGATREHVALYVRDLTVRPAAGRVRPGSAERPAGLANATILQRLTAIRLYYDFLVEEGLRPDNPVGRGRYTPGKGFAGERGRGLVPRYRTLPWIPDDGEWRAVLEAARAEPLRNRLMLALAYDAGLRREELCLLAAGDVDPARRLLHVRAETTKGRRARVVPYSPPTGALLAAYLVHRRALTRERGPLFVSESRRNRARPITLWTWSKVVRGLGRRAGLPRLSTHTLRHLCLTDLARTGWELHEIAAFAGHRSTTTTLLYIHLSGRELAAKLAQAASLHGRRMAQIGEALA